MKTLQELKNKACENVYKAKLDDPLMESLMLELFSTFSVQTAEKLIARTNRLPKDLIGNRLKGALGEAIVAAAMSFHFAHFDGKGFFDMQYEMWIGRDIDAAHPMRTMDIIFIMPATDSIRGQVTFQVEVKNYRGAVPKPKLVQGDLRTQVEKDKNYLNPKDARHMGIVPVWWFLQGVDQAASGFLRGNGIRVVDFTKELRQQINQAFAVPPQMQQQAARSKAPSR